MTAYSLSKTRFREGVWEGIVAGDSPGTPSPAIKVVVRDQNVEDVALKDLEEAGCWLLQVPVASNWIADGTHTFVIEETNSGQTLGDFSIIAGDAAGEDIRAELDLLRAELDMLKRSFRRHCRETA